MMMMTGLTDNVDYPYGVTMSVTLVANDVDDYSIGATFEDSEDRNFAIEACGETLDDVIAAMVEELYEELEQLQEDMEDELAAEDDEDKVDTLYQVINSLETDNQLLERRVNELTQQIQELRSAQTSTPVQKKEEKIKRISDDDFANVLRFLGHL